MTYILHISDLHFKKNAAAYNTEEIIIKEAAEKVYKVPEGNKLLIVTGDFHDYWDTDYERAESFLTRLTQAMGIDITQDVFVIPGNHDVGNQTTMIACGCPDTIDIVQDKAVEQLMQWTTNKDHKRFLSLRMEAFRPYIQFVQALGIYDITSGYSFPATTHVRSWRGKLNILHLNTALVANGKAKNDQMTDTDAAADPATWEGYFQKDVPTLAIGHNSFFDLHKDRMAELATLFTFRNVSAYLCGDTHQTEKDPYKQMIRLEAGHKKGEEIPNLVAAKVIADGNDTYSEIGYCWHEWNEETGDVNVEFRKWEKSCLARTASGGSGNYQMRSVDVDKETLNLVDESEEKENGKLGSEEASEPDFLPSTYVEAVRRLNARLRKAQSKVRVYYWDELDFSSIYIIPFLRKRPEESLKASLNIVDNLQSINDNNEKDVTRDELLSIAKRLINEVQPSDSKDLSEMTESEKRNGSFSSALSATLLHHELPTSHLLPIYSDVARPEISRALAEKIYREHRVAYGITTGFGDFATVADSDYSSTNRIHETIFKTFFDFQPLSGGIDTISSKKNEEDDTVTVEEKLSIIGSLFSYSKIIYIVGGAGFGKSLFLKKLCVDPHLINGYSQKPFLVLRGDIKNMIRSDGSIKPMLDFLEERLTAGSFEKSQSIGPHFLEDCLKAGRCLILLDALDEVGNDIRTELHELIVSFFQETYPGNRICITSRERGFIPKKDIDCYYISRIKRTDIEQYIDRFIAIDKFAPDEKEPFLEKASVLVDNGFIQGFLTLSLLLAIYKNELSLPTNKLLLYEKCFEYIANSREQSKKLLKNSKTGEEYDWNALGTLLQDATFMEFASLGYPNNRDVSVRDIEETIFSLYGGRFE